MAADRVIAYLGFHDCLFKKGRARGRWKEREGESEFDSHIKIRPVSLSMRRHITIAAQKVEKKSEI